MRNIPAFSSDVSTISLVPVAEDDLREVQDVFDAITAYSERVDGVPKRENAAYEFATSLPSGREPHHKHAFLAKLENTTVGLLDIIHGHPSPDTAFIGLLAVRENAQGSGLGRAIFHEGERFARNILRAHRMRLAVVETNPVVGFWMKMGFRPTGEVGSFAGKAAHSRVLLMEKRLLDGSSIHDDRF